MVNSHGSELHLHCCACGFAYELGEKLNIPVTLETALREIGLANGRVDPATLYPGNCPEAIDGFWADPVAKSPPGGEPFTRFPGACQRLWMQSSAITPGKHLLVVAHGGVIRLIIAQVLGMPASNIFRMDVPYAAVSRELWSSRLEPDSSFSRRQL